MLALKRPVALGLVAGILIGVVATALILPVLSAPRVPKTVSVSMTIGFANPIPVSVTVSSSTPLSDNYYLNVLDSYYGSTLYDTQYKSYTVTVKTTSYTVNFLAPYKGLGTYAFVATVYGSNGNLVGSIRTAVSL